MFPVHGCTLSFAQSYPQNQFPQFIHYNCPLWGAIPPVINTDAVRAPSGFANSPSNAYPCQFESSACHNHNCYPGYHTMFPPQPQSQQLPVYYFGPYPPYPNLMPCYYYPSTGYLPEQHRGNNLGNNHCCRCPNHNCPKGDTDHLQSKDQKLSGQNLENCFYSLPNNPYQMICVPNANQNNLVEDTSKFNSMQPNSWKGWMPLNALPRKDLEPAGEADKKDGQKNDNRMESFPIIWMPEKYLPEQSEKDLNEVQQSPKIEEIPSCDIKVIPVKQSDCGNPDDNGAKAQQDPEAQDDQVDSKKVNKSKTIPVQHVPSFKENHVSGIEKHVNEEVKLKTNVRENGNENTCSPQSGRKSTSVKSLKLPPVCLRVDPLPKNKKENGSSGLSNSQQGQKKVTVTDSTQKCGPGKEALYEKLEKVIKVEGNEVNRNKQNVQVLNSSLCGTESLDYRKQSELGCNANKIDITEGKEPDSASGTPSCEDGKKRLHLSETDAAITIQSTYRGYEVRKWQPIKKLRQIKAVHAKVADIKDKINNLETYGEQPDSKSKIFLSETIMNLLLELDTIQGLQPNVRDIRKSVARELVSLQEKLDLLKKLPDGVDKLSESFCSEQAHDLQKAKANETAASAMENSSPHTPFFEAENSVTCINQGCSKQLEYDYSVGQEEGCSSEKKFGVNMQSSNTINEHLPDESVSFSVEDCSCTGASMNCISTYCISRVPSIDEINVCAMDTALPESSETRSNQLEYSPEIRDDVSLVDNGGAGSSTEDVFNLSSECEKEGCTKDLDCSFQVPVHPDSSMVNDIPVYSKTDEALSCLGFNPSANDQLGVNENAGNEEQVNVSLEKLSLPKTMQDDLLGDHKDMPGDCCYLERKPLDLLAEQEKQLQANEPRPDEMAIIPGADKESGGSENAGNKGKKTVRLKMVDLQTTMRADPLRGDEQKDMSEDYCSLEQLPSRTSPELEKQMQAEEPRPDEVLRCLYINSSADIQSGGSGNAENKEKENASSELNLIMQGDPLGGVQKAISEDCYSLERQHLGVASELENHVQPELPRRSLVYLDVKLRRAEERDGEKLGIVDELPVENIAVCTEMGELKQVLLGGGIHEDDAGDETCYLSSCMQSGMIKPECLSNSDQTASDKGNVLAADGDTAVVAGTVSAAPDVICGASEATALGASEAMPQEIPPESCFPSEQVQLENCERPDAGGPLFLEPHEEWKKLRDQDEQLRTMLHKLFEAGQKQMQVISDLSGRINHLERRLSQKRRLRVKKRKGIAGAAAAGLNLTSAKYAA